MTDSSFRSALLARYDPAASAANSTHRYAPSFVRALASTQMPPDFVSVPLWILMIARTCSSSHSYEALRAEPLLTWRHSLKELIPKWMFVTTEFLNRLANYIAGS